MKYITLVRHAKSSWQDTSLDDIDRPLKKRGIRDAHHMALYLKGENIIPDFIVSSPATRAFETASIFVDNIFEEAIPIVKDEILYFEGARPMVHLIKRTKEELGNSLFLFGHMPDIASVFTELTGEFILEYPTCAVSHISFDVDTWKEVEVGEGKKEFFIYPKMMPWHNENTADKL